jgi:cytochrome d ubiquinol oxidase subunit II
MLAAHGAIYLVMKTEGELQARIERVLPRLLVTFFVLNTLVVIAMVLFRQDITERYTNDIWPVIFPAAALAALIGAWTFVRRGETFRAFICSSAMIALLIVSGAVGIYPNLLISTTDPAYNLTVTNAASADNTLTVTLIVALIGMPFVLLYTAGVYWFFRGKATVDSHGY